MGEKFRKITRSTVRNTKPKFSAPEYDVIPSRGKPHGKGKGGKKKK